MSYIFLSMMYVQLFGAERNADKHALQFEGTLWENREGYERWDPARWIDNWSTPHMLIHGELDYRLPVTEALSVFNVLQEKGIPSKFLYFPDENHW